MKKYSVNHIIKSAKSVEMITEFLKWNLVLAAKNKEEMWVQSICLILQNPKDLLHQNESFTEYEIEIHLNNDKVKEILHNSNEGEKTALEHANLQKNMLMSIELMHVKKKYIRMKDLRLSDVFVGMQVIII